MGTIKRNRVRSGTRSGGQFASERRAEPHVIGLGRLGHRGTTVRSKLVPTGTAVTTSDHFASCLDHLGVSDRGARYRNACSAAWEKMASGADASHVDRLIDEGFEVWVEPREYESNPPIFVASKAGRHAPVVVTGFITHGRITNAWGKWVKPLESPFHDGEIGPIADAAIAFAAAN